MRACVIFNPQSGSSDGLEALSGMIQRESGWVLRPASGDGPDSTRRLASRARDEGFDLVVAAGGDGTVSEVIEGIMAATGPHAPKVGILPFGTGNDLARTLAVPFDPREAFTTLLEGRVRWVDLALAESESGAAKFVANCAAGGFSGDVNRAMESESKALLGPLAYVLGGLRALPAMKPYRVNLLWDDSIVEPMDALNIVIANGRSVAGGFPIAPNADIEDGLLDVIVIRDGNALQLAQLAAGVAAGAGLTGDLVVERKARTLRVSSEPPMLFNADGEMMAATPVSYRAVPRALCMVVGAEYRRPAPSPEATAPSPTSEKCSQDDTTHLALRARA